MIKHLTVEQLRYIANGGGGLEVNGPSYTAEQLRYVANGGKNKGAKLKVFGCACFTAEQMRYIANGNPGCVTFTGKFEK